MPPKRKRIQYASNDGDGDADGKVRIAAPVNTDIQPVIPLPSLNFFTRNPIQMSVQNVKEEEILPTGNVFAVFMTFPPNTLLLSDLGNWEGRNEIMFNIKGDPEMMIDPSSLRIRASVKIVKFDGSPVDLQYNSAPISNFAGALFEKVQVRLGNSTEICGFDSLYPFLSYLENVFKASVLEKKQMDFTSFLFLDEDNKFNEMNDTNPGFKERKTQAGRSQEITLTFPIISPITTQGKLLPPNVGLSLDMHRANNSFLIMSSDEDAEEKVQFCMCFLKL